MTEPFFAQFHVPTRIVCQPQIATDFSAEWAQCSATAPLIVTDPGVRAAGLVATVEQGVRAAGATPVAIFDAVPPNSELRVIDACVALARQHAADSVIAIGGGSAIDTAKLVALLLTHGGDLQADYAGAQTVPGPLLPLVVFPTTAGTGSEVTSAAVVYDADTKRKLSFIDGYLRPQLAVLDPALTLKLPPQLTAATGMDAITHAIEAFVDLPHTPFADACAIQALRLAQQWLEAAVRDGRDLDARQGMMMAATLAGIAFDHSMVGVVHSLSHAIGGLTGLHHGTANSIMLPIGMAYNAAVCGERYAELARAIGVNDLGAWQGTLRTNLHALCGLPRTLHEAGIAQTLAADIAHVAEEDGTSFYNPRPVEAEALQPLLETMWA